MHFSALIHPWIAARITTVILYNEEGCKIRILPMLAVGTLYLDLTEIDTYLSGNINQYSKTKAISVFDSPISKFSLTCCCSVY